MSVLILAAGSAKTARPRPTAPTREDLLMGQFTFQGLTVQTQQFGTLPWFEPCIGWFTGPTRWADVDAVLKVKADADDQIVQVAVSGQYAEANQAYQHIPGVNYWNDLAGLNTLLDYLIERGWWIDLRCGFDGTGPDPVGLTWGWQFGMDNYARLAASLGPRLAYCKINPAYDGWCPAWDASQAQAFGEMVIATTPSVVLVGEFAIGYSHMGGGEADYAPGGCLSAYDAFEGEFEAEPNTGLIHDDNVWQIVARMSRPYIRPADQPAHDDPNPPFYLGGVNSRGLPYRYRALEWLIYYEVRWEVPDGTAANDQNRGYLQALSPGMVTG